MKKTIVSFLFVLFILANVNNVYALKNDVDNLKEVDEVITVYTDYNFPPYEYLDAEGKPIGFDIDLIERIAEIMDLKLDIRAGIWKDIRNKLETGQIDLLLGMYYSEERDKILDFSAPHSIVNFGVFMRKDSDIRIRNEVDLKNLNIVIQDEDIMEDYLRKENITPNIVETNTHIEALQQLLLGDYDCALVGSLQGAYFLELYNLENIYMSGELSFQKGLCFAVQEGNDKLLSKLDEGLLILKETGEYRQLREKWFQVYEEKARAQQYAERIRQYRNLGILIVSIILSLGIFLKIAVNRRIRELKESNKLISKELEIKNSIIEEKTKLLEKDEKLLLDAEYNLQLKVLVFDMIENIYKSLEICNSATDHIDDNGEKMLNNFRYYSEKPNEERSGKLNMSGNIDIRDATAITNNMYHHIEKEKEISGLIKYHINVIENQMESIKKMYSLESEVVENINLKKTIEDCVSYLKEHTGYEFELELEIQSALEINIVKEDLYRIFMELIKNSIEHGYENIEDKMIQIAAYTIGKDLYMIYEDHGIGIDKEIKDDIFNLFYTSKKESHLGIGLNVAKGIVQNKLNGKFVYEHDDLNKTRFKIILFDKCTSVG